MSTVAGYHVVLATLFFFTCKLSLRRKTHVRIIKPCIIRNCMKCVQAPETAHSDLKKKKKKKKKTIFAKLALVDLCFLQLPVYRFVWCSSTFHMGNMNLQFSAITMRMHFLKFYMRIYAYFDVRSNTLCIDFVFDINRTLNRTWFYFIKKVGLWYLP